MATFYNSKKLGKHLKKALDQLQAETLITTQAELGSSKVSPVDTGRFRSSWFAAEGSASSAVAPEGTDDPNEDAQQLALRVDSNKTYHLTNNLPYAEAVALGVNTPPSWGGGSKVKSKSPNWFYDFVNSRVPKIQAAAARVVKREFEL